MKRAAMISAAALLTAGGLAWATESPSNAVANKALYGVKRTSGQLVRYDFSKSELGTVAAVKDKNGNVFSNIDSVAYFPDLLNAYAFQMGSNNKQRLIYVDLQSAVGTVVFSDMEGGKLMGASALHTTAKPYKVYAIQQAKIKPPSSITGAININPNNSPQNEFTLTKSNGTTITRDHLHQQTNVDANGTFYQGGATFIHVKPKGNGNQNSLVVNDVVFPVQNANTYDFQGEMQVRVWNDHIKNSKAMGHWWISIISGQVYVNGETQIESPDRLVEVSVTTGTVTELVRLTTSYTALATQDGNTFYTFKGADLYRIDATTETATKVGTSQVTTPTSANFVDSYLIVHDGSQNKFVVVNPATGQTIGSPATLGTSDLSGTFFTPLTKDPANKPLGAYD